MRPNGSTPTRSAQRLQAPRSSWASSGFSPLAEDGINVISGTGSMTYGEHGTRGVRVGGWAELFGDEGSAYWIAIHGLNVFSKMSDGRLEKGPLHEIFSAQLDLPSDLDVVDRVINQWHGGRSEIAALSPLVVRAAEAGDGEARRILSDAVRELTLVVETTRRRLDFAESSAIPVSYSGGVFTSPTVREMFRRELLEHHRGYDLRTPRYSPAIGAALYAAKLAGNPLDEAALKTLPSA